MTDDVLRPAEERDDGFTGTVREEALPEHERDDESTVGGGLMSAGGTAVDRGTGELGGMAEGPEPAEEGQDTTPPAPMGVIAATSPNAAQPTYAPVNSDESAAPDELPQEDEDR